MAQLSTAQLESIRQRISQDLCDFAKLNDLTKVVVGSSGGIDSAITLTLAAGALGADNVNAITMPSKWSSQGSVMDSEALCTNLGIKLDTVPIGDMVSGFSNEFASSTLQQQVQGLALENLQARMRGVILMTYSNLNGNLVLATGNKSEASVGYCTLYGDTVGGLNLIGDIYKTEIYQLAQYLNERAGTDLIPPSIMEKAPSAELAPGQKDEDSLPPYPVLDAALQMIQEPPSQAKPAEVAFNALVAAADRKAVMERVRGLITKSEFKRKQLPPVIKVRSLIL